MNTVLWQPDEAGFQYAQGWALSIVLHGAAIGVAIALLSDLHLATRPDAFRWQVSVVGTNPSIGQHTAVATVEPSPVSPAPITPSADATAPAKADAVSAHILTPAVTAPAFSRHSATRRERSVETQTHSSDGPEALGVMPEATAPTDPSQSTPFATATSTSSIVAPPVENRPRTVSSEPAPSAALSTSTVPAEEPAVSPSRDVSTSTAAVRETLPETESTGAPAASSNADHSSSPPSPIQEARIAKPDFSWLTDSLRSRVQQSQKYSTVARLNGLEGRVVLRITVKDTGELLVAVASSSGHALLDQDAVEQVTRLSPLPLLQPLGRDHRVFNLPITYSLNR